MMRLTDVIRQYWFGGVVLLGIAFWMGWTASSWYDSDEVCDALVERYEYVSSGFYKSVFYDIAAEDYRYYQDIYGQEVAQLLADEQASSADLGESVILGALADNGCDIPDREAPDNSN